jgi:hypothetical protein
MTRLITFLVPLLMFGAARAQDMDGIVQDVPITEPNYLAIIIFLVISVGSCGWYLWKVLNQKEENDQDAK